MPTRRSGTAAVVLACVAAAARADDFPPGVGIEAASGTVFRTSIEPAGDADDFVFRGFAGMSVTATLKLAPGSGLHPDIQVIRPDGSRFDPAGELVSAAKSKARSVSFTVDATGWWKVRVLATDTSTGAYDLALKYDAPVLPPLPETIRTRTFRGVIEPVLDTDDFTFPALAGQELSATLALGRGSGLDSSMSLVRPDGSIAAQAGRGAREKRLVIARTLDADGAWRIVVAGEDDPGFPFTDATTGAYTLTLKLGKAAEVSAQPDANGQLRFPFPAVGGAAIGWTLSSVGSAPVFNSLRDGRGVPVANVPAALSVRPFALEPDLLLGDFSLVFDVPPGTTPADVRLERTLTLPKTAAPKKVTLAALEPVILSTPDAISPAAGGAGTVITVRALHLPDANAPKGALPRLFVGHTPLLGIELLPDGTTVRGTLLANLPLGTYDIVVTSSSGQAAARADAFRVIPAPVVESADSQLAPTAGGASVTIRGRNFTESMGVLFSGVVQPLTPTALTPTSLTFVTPPHAAGVVTLGVRDHVSQRNVVGDGVTLRFFDQPFVQRVVPPLVPVLGGDTVALEGFLFSATDKVFLETTTANVFEEITASQPTFLNTKTHRFAAPVRPKGSYRVFVEDTNGNPNPRQPRTLSYFSYADVTGSSGPLDGGVVGESVSTALADFDADGDLDLVLARRGGDTASASSLLRVLRNDGTGAFADVTASVVPPVGVDDWRADRVVAADIDADGVTDLVLTTNSKTVPPPDRGHTRLLMSELRGGTGAGAADRVLRDRTTDLMAPVRKMKRYGLFGGSGAEYVSDPWRGLDVWVGDLDKSGAGPPEIVITHDEVKDDDNYNADVFKSGVYCGNYCVASMPAGFVGYSYTFYWGGSRQFVWDKTARGGLGRFKFDASRFPRRSGPMIPTGGGPDGGIVVCSAHYNRRCKDTFTPFTGERVAVRDLNADGKDDVAVLSRQAVQRRAKVNDPLLTISSLQVGLAGFNPKEGSGVTDVTSLFTALGHDLRGQAVAIAHTGFPDANSFGTIALAATTPVAGRSLRLLRWTSAEFTGPVEDVTGLTLPAAGAGDAFPASEIRLADADLDGDEDMVLVSTSADGAASALRILRNTSAGATRGVFDRSLDGLLPPIAAAGDRYEGETLVIGDLTGDGTPEYVVSRPATSVPGSGTRVISTDR